MALNIKDPTAEQLAAEVAELTGESKTRAVRVALAERRDRLVFEATPSARRGRLWRLLEDEIWPSMPPEVLGTTISKEDEEEILGFGPDGV